MVRIRGTKKRLNKVYEEILEKGGVEEDRGIQSWKIWRKICEK